MLLKALLNIYQLVSNFNLLLSLIDTKFVIHLHNSISLTISYSEHDIMESEDGNCFYTLGEKKKAMFAITQFFSFLLS